MDGFAPEGSPIGTTAERDRPALNRFALPRTIYVYLALLIASYIVPSLVAQILPVSNRIKSAGKQAELTSGDFERYVSAETNVQLAFALSGKTKGSQSAGDSLGNLLTSAMGGQRDKLLSDSRTSYITLGKSTHSPNMIRRALILDHVLGKPLDQALLERSLRPNLHLDGVSPASVAGEIRFWQALYVTKRIAPSDASADEKRVREMKLGFLETRCLADLWSAAGNSKAAAASEAQFRVLAANFLRGRTVVAVLEVVAFFGGLAALLTFFVAALTRDWRIVRRVATAPLHLLWGELLDCFVFYIGIYRFVSLCGGLVLKITGAQPDAHTLLSIEASMQIFTGAASLAYLTAKAKRHGVTIAEIGMTVRGSFLREVAYGVAGYLAALPLLVVMALVSKQIFRHSTNTAPNPILPLMVGVHDPVSRWLIFLMASLAAPFLEETFFRGALFTGLRTRYGWSLSAVLSAMCFALVHPMQDWLPIFALGFAFATMREMRQSLVPGMTAHFLQNTVTYVALSALFSS